jgi:hypothetical protein
MIFEFLFPIIGWLVLFIICYVVYVNVFNKDTSHKVVEGQAVYMVLASFFWIVVYMCLSSVWSILYSLIDLKYPDVVGAVSDYGTSGFAGSGVVYDAFAFPLAMTLVSAVTACLLALFLIRKFQKNPELRPEKLYLFLKALVFIGGVVLAFSGFVYVVYSWLYGNLPIAIFYKGLVAAGIVGGAAMYFYFVGDGKNKSEGLISRVFAGALVVLTIVTLYVSFQVIGTPAEARKYRLDSITVEAIKQIKYEIDNQDQSYGKRITKLDELTSDYVKGYIRKMNAAQNPVEYSTDGKEFKLCANFNSDMPQTINWDNRDVTWDYKMGNHCFTFQHLPAYPNVISDPNRIPKPVY